MSTGFGLASDGWTWVLALSLVLAWVFSLSNVANVRRRGWVAVPTSLFGLAWLGFGFSMILRFGILSYDSVTFGNGTLRLANLAPDVVNRTLLYLTLFWALFAVMFRLSSVRRWLLPLRHLDAFTPRRASRIAVISILVTSACISLSLWGRTPGALVTPLARVGSLWIVPATILWWQHFKMSRRRGLRAWFAIGPTVLLLPGLMQAFLSPYRENLLMALSVPFFAALLAGKRPRLPVVVAAGVLLLISSTIVIDLYRELRWSGVTQSELSVLARDYREDYVGSLIRSLSRFQALDAMLLTVDLTPRVIPYTGENVLLGALSRGMIPRIINPAKAMDNKAVRFGEGVWSYDAGAPGGAAIASSMPGDLYSAGGFTYVLIGAMMWGTLVGVVESWKRRLLPHSQAVILALFAFMTMAAIERDFEHVIATSLQLIAVLVVLFSGFIPLVRSRHKSTLASRVLVH